MQTGDADFAQFHEISLAVGDTLPPILDVLHRVDRPSAKFPAKRTAGVSTQFVSRDKFKVEFLTPNRGPDDISGNRVQMPALGGAAALPLRFLDFLIRFPVRVVLLHGAGVPILIRHPSGTRYTS